MFAVNATIRHSTATDTRRARILKSIAKLAALGRTKAAYVDKLPDGRIDSSGNDAELADERLRRSATGYNAAKAVKRGWQVSRPGAGYAKPDGRYLIEGTAIAFDKLDAAKISAGGYCNAYGRESVDVVDTHTGEIFPVSI